AGAASAVEAVLPGRGAGARQHPGRRAGAAGGQSLGRHPDRGHVRVRAGVLRRVRAAEALPPAGARPGVQAAGCAREPVALRDRAGVAREHGARARARLRAARLSGRRPRDVQTQLGVRQDRLRRPDRLRPAGDRARRADRAGGGDRRAGDRVVPGTGPAARATPAAGQPAQAEGVPGAGGAAVRLHGARPAGAGAAALQDRRAGAPADPPARAGPGPGVRAGHGQDAARADEAGVGANRPGGRLKRSYRRAATPIPSPTGSTQASQASDSSSSALSARAEASESAFQSVSAPSGSATSPLISRLSTTISARAESFGSASSMYRPYSPLLASTN